MIGKKLGAYEIIEEIGVGGMATVYRAKQASMGRFVAIKVIHRAIAIDSTAVERFEREARVIARLEHPHILPVYDYDGTHDPPYIVMRYLPTGTLKDILERTRLPLEDIVHIMRQVTSALDYAHRQGVIHRDIKPSNIMIDEDGNVFLTDFGIARMTEGGHNITASGMAVGTPGYMAPEQILGSEVDGRADVYALGVMLFEMLAGEMPYQSDTPMAVVMKHLNEPIPSIRKVDSSLSEQLDAMVHRAMAKSPADRYQTGAALARDLTQMITAPVETPQHLQTVAQQTITDLKIIRAQVTAQRQRQPTTATDAVPAIEGATYKLDTTGVQQQARRNRMLGIGALLILAVLVIGGLLVVLGGGDEDKEASITDTPDLPFTQTALAVIEARETSDANSTETAIALLPAATEESATETPSPTVADTDIAVAETVTEPFIPVETLTDTPTVTLTETPTETLLPTETETPTETPSEAFARVVVSQGTIYQEPFTLSPVVNIAPEGSRLLVTGETPDGNWLLVEFLGITGWIYREQVQVSGNLETILVIIPSPTNTPTETPSPTITPSETSTPTDTPTNPPIASPTSEFTPTASPTNTLIPTPTPIPAGVLPFVEDLEGDDPLREWEYDPAQWQLRPEGGNMAIYGTTGFNSALTVLGKTVPEWVRREEDDLLISFRVNLVDGNSGGRFIFKFDPNYGYYVLEIASGLITFKRGEPGAAPDRPTEFPLATLVGGNAPITNGRWYEFIIWAEGARTYIYLEKSLIISVNDAELPPAPGAILLQTFSSQANPVGWDDFIIQHPELASDHFQGSDFPTTWERSSQANVTVGVEPGSTNQYIQLLEEAVASPVIPPLGDFTLYARLNNTQAGFRMYLREFNQAGLEMYWYAGNIEMTQRDSEGNTVWTGRIPNFYGRGNFEEVVMTLVGERLTVYNDGRLFLEEDLPGLPPSGTVRFETRAGDGLRIDDFLIAETTLTSTVDAEFAFQIMSELAARAWRQGRWDWEDEFRDPFLSRTHWESDPGQYLNDETVDFDAEHRFYYVMTGGEFGDYRRFKPQLDSTRTVFGNGEDRSTFRDSVDIYVEANVRLPDDNPVGAEAWVGVRSEPNVSGGLYQYRISLVRAENGDTLVRVSPQTQTNRTPIFEEAITLPEDGWNQLVIVAYDDRMAFFLNGRFLVAVRDVPLLGGSLAFGVEANTTAHFDDVVVRDTSVNE